MNYINVKHGGGQNFNAPINKIPDSCPICNRHIAPIQIASQFKDETKKLEVVYLCVNSQCKSYFLSYFDHIGKNYQFTTSLPKTLLKSDFSKEIHSTSPIFIEIYNQASAAEQQNLNHIAGVGFRKALEFLIKDYLIQKTPEEEEKIKKELLGNTIKTRISDLNIKNCSERAIWLGNDETHYTKKWENKDINDLKILLQLTVKWIEAEILTKNYLEEMNH